MRLLCEAARAECDREPEFSLSLADTACLIADSLPHDYYPAAAINHLRGNAWKEYSTACRYLGRFDNSFDALDRAARAYERLKDSEIQRTYLSKIIPQLFGKSLGVLLREKQLAEAKRLLELVDPLGMDDIAAASAFGHRSTFYRVFRAAFGITPAEYRRTRSYQLRLDSAQR